VIAEPWTGQLKQKIRRQKKQKSKPKLLVEDDHVDAMTAERTLKDLKVTNQVVHKANSEEAWSV